MKFFVVSTSTLLLCLLLFTQSIFAQTKQQLKAEKALVDYLNKICKTHTENQMTIDMGTIVEPYSIKNGILSVVRKHISENDSSVFFVRTSVDVNTIQDVFYDYYIGFVGNSHLSVTTEKTIDLKNSFKKSGTMELMHVAPVDDSNQGPIVQEKLLQLVNNIKMAHSKGK